VAVAVNVGYNYQRAAVATSPHEVKPGTTVSSHQDVSAPQQNLDKHFYYFSAPEEHFDESKELKKVIGSTKKNLRVIFIKSPENKGYENAVLNLAKNAVEQKTHIYVLNKQTDTAGLAQKFQAAQAATHHHKPEVHFVKYNSAADAEHALQTIKAQYDSLGGGQSVHVQGGVAPVINFINSAGGDKPTAAHKGSVNREYLAPAVTGITNVNREYLAPATTGTTNVNREYLAPPATGTTNVNREYLAPAITGATNVNRAYLVPPAEDTPVDKNYANEFLPSGSDVTPGTSYIPLTLRAYRRQK